MKKGDYIIYKLIKGEKEVSLFFLPEKEYEGVRRKIDRLLTLKSYKSQGYSIFSISFVDKETYLNLKLDERVKEYCYIDQFQRDYKNKLSEVGSEVYFDTIQSCEDSKWTSLKQISIIIRRLIREGFDINNEIGIQLYDQYIKAVM